MASVSKQALKTGSFADQVRFLRNWAAKPLTTGAVSPSGRALTKLMASFVDPTDDRPVIELGPGTGVVTEALLERGVAPKRIFSIEYNPDFCKLLEDRFKGVRIVQGDAYTLNATLKGIVEGDVNAVISSLPLFTRPPETRRALIVEALARMPVGRPFIQFSYALVPPVPAEAGRFTVEHTHWVIRNLPPARVWLYRRVA
ncbi:phospholipid methyltransferase [Kaistia dalseonensis]|uniref:Phosphatidylethanolamine/phosphatidyl-N-methylethanolamine N-methyltransferase n=1 Tax=Kaistia dalseonensis TaxID=410840 RepID=A0ABU0H572_9HYPH|nr:rRNA adenine N-6-methyltransferase family protein [Kaistia dalseonensis]MCX5494886.1 phospholipid methyltransferase [Kaistia dalseonensis]MDQ0437467.1 phosphatidylethanolamine/phosphatidyl-N-methylethanolamine N-methyltransferase [Kaistia dalseonensis]